MQVRLLPDALVSETASNWPVRLSAQDGGPSSRKGGFDSRTGYSQRRERNQRPRNSKNRRADTRRSPGVDNTHDRNRPSGATGRHATLRTSCPDGLGSSTLPLVTREPSTNEAGGPVPSGA